MKWFGITAALAAVLAVVVATPAAAHPAAQATQPSYALPSLDPNTTFVEGLAFDHSGNMYVGVTSLADDGTWTGLVYRMTPSGDYTLLADDVPVTAEGFLTGLAVDNTGAVYIADVTFSDEPAAGVYRVYPGPTKPVLKLPAESLPNGIAFLGQKLYVTDSLNGVVWQASAAPGRLGNPPTVWSDDPLLAGAFGANGIAFWRGAMYVAVSDLGIEPLTGRIVKIPFDNDGAAGTARVVKQGTELYGADGIAFDIAGNLYFATSLDGPYRLGSLAPSGTLSVLADENDGLGYPASVAFGTLPGDRTTLYVTNAFTSTVLTFDVGIRGFPLP